jgi:hypothetical protein
MFSFEENINVTKRREDVFLFIADGEKASPWNSAVKNVEKISSGPIGQGTRYRMIRQLPSGRVENEYEITEFVPFTTIVIQTVSGPTPFTYRYELDSKGDGTRITLKGEIETSDVSRIPETILKIGLRRGVRQNLEVLKSILENRAK